MNNTNTQLIVGSNHSFKVRFHRTPESASNLDPVIPSGTIVEYSCGNINEDFVMDREGKVVGSKRLTCALQYVPVTWNERRGFLWTGDVSLLLDLSRISPED
jgi:hypothetical protein